MWVLAGSGHGCCKCSAASWFWQNLFGFGTDDHQSVLFAHLSLVFHCQSQSSEALAKLTSLQALDAAVVTLGPDNSVIR